MKINDVCLLSFLIVCFGICSTMRANASELNGIVKSESGKPLSGVRVFTDARLQDKQRLVGLSLSTQHYETKSDQNGHFHLRSHGKFVYFWRDDLRPLTKIVEPTTGRIEVTMEEGDRTVWRIPSCSSLTDNSQRIGIAFKVLAPESILVQKTSQFENGGYLFGNNVHGNIETLIIWSDSTSLLPDEGYLLDSPGFSERAWVSGKTLGYDIRGVKSNGKVWRRVSFRWGAITYQGNSKESADVFDRLIDGMCFNESDLK